MDGRGIVIKRTKGFYYLINEANEEVECKVKGLLFKDSRFDNQIAVGDWVEYRKAETDDVGLIVSIEKRKSFLSRNRVGVEAEQIIAANVDHLVIVASAKKPAFRRNLVNRLLVAANVGNIKPTLLITKTDLCDQEAIDQLLLPYRNSGLEILTNTTSNPKPNPKLYDLLLGKISVLAGQSGVGKSTLLNTLFPGLNIRVGAISKKTSKGSHTTTYATMHRIAENSNVIDTPGIREFGLWKVTRKNLSDYYPVICEFELGCKHRDCCHVHEPGCSIKSAVKEGKINKELYGGYLDIFDSLNPY